MIAGHQARSPGTDAVTAQRRDSCFLDGRMMRQVEVVVAAERQQAPAVALHPNSIDPRGCHQRAAKIVALELAELGECEFIE